jgi:hypothetical protein
MVVEFQLCAVTKYPDLDRADDLANETEAVAGSEFRGATIRLGDLTVNSEAQPGAPTNINECTLRKLVID